MSSAAGWRLSGTPRVILSATSGSRVGPDEGPLVAVAAHADQIGLIVTHVDERGYVSIERVGGVAPLLVPGRHVVHGRRRRLCIAVGGRKPTHIIPTGRPRQGTGAGRAVPRHRRRRAPRRAREAGRRSRDLHAGLRGAHRRRGRHAGARRPRRRLRHGSRARAVRGRSGRGAAHRLGDRARGDDLHGRQGAGAAPRPMCDRARRRLLQRHAGRGREGAGRRGQARRRPRPHPRRRQ